MRLSGRRMEATLVNYSEVDAFRRGLQPFFCGPAPGGGREGLLKFSARLGALSVAKQKRSQELMRWLIDRRWTKGDRKRRFQGDGPAQQLFSRCHVIYLLSHQAFGLGQKYLGSEAVGRIGVSALCLQIRDGVREGFEFDQGVARGGEIPSRDFVNRARKRKVELRARPRVSRHRPACDLATPISRIEEVSQSHIGE